MADVNGTSGYLQLHKQSTKAKLGPSNQSGVGNTILKGARMIDTGVEAYIAHLERQLSKAGSSGERAALKQAEASMKQLEGRIKECFELIQGTQGFCEELARDSHARFEDAQSRIRRCERACRTAYSKALHPDRVEALVREETLSLEKRLLQAVDEKCGALQLAVLKAVHSPRSDACSLPVSSSDDTCKEAEDPDGMRTHHTCKSCKPKAEGNVSSQGVQSAKARHSDDTKRETQLGVKLQEGEKCRERCSEYKPRSKTEAGLEEMLRNSLDTALAQIAEAARTAAQEVAAASGRNQEGQQDAERRPSTSKTERHGGPYRQLEAPGQPKGSCTSTSEEERKEDEPERRLPEGLGREASEQLAQLNAAVSALQSDTSDLRRSNLLQAAKEEKLNERLSSIEGSIQRLEDSMERTSDELGRLSATGRMEAEALSLQHEQVAAALGKHVDAVASLQASVNDLATCLLDSKRGLRTESTHQTDVHERLPEDKRMVNGHEEKRAATQEKQLQLEEPNPNKDLRDTGSKEKQLAEAQLESRPMEWSEHLGGSERGLKELELLQERERSNKSESGGKNDQNFVHSPSETSPSKENLLAKFLSVSGKESALNEIGHVERVEWTSEREHKREDEGSAYSRALAMTEERKRRLDKLYRELASTPSISSPLN